MALSATCECGKRMAVADVMAGRTIRCQSCGGDVFVPAAAPSANRSASGKSSARQKADATPAFEVSPGIITAAIVGLVLLVIVLALYFGPWTVGKQWAAMSPHANDTVTDVVQFAIQAYESQHYMFNANASHFAPTPDGPAAFVPPMMAFTMPRRIIFSGKTNQGNYIGTYDTTSGEVIADIETGGFTVGGLVDVKKATGKFHITGREKDGKVEAEVDGTPLHIRMAPPHRRGED